MPYTIEERNELDFYKSFVSQLRNTHINAIKEFIPNKFRDNNGVLQSFEDISSGLGLEDATFEDGGSLYETALFNPNIEGTTQNKSTFFDSVRNSTLTSQDTKLKQYTKSELLNNTINRNFSELDMMTTSTLPAPLLSGSALPNGEILSEDIEVENGDLITLGISEDMIIWLIEDNKKRAFVNKEDFFNSRYSETPLKVLPLDIVKSIDDGKLIILERKGFYTGVTLSPTTTTTTVADTPYSKPGVDV